MYLSIISILVCALSLLATVLIGWQIHQLISISKLKKEFEAKNKTIDAKIEEAKNRVFVQSYGVMSHITRSEKTIPLYLYFSFSQLLAYSKMPNNERMVEHGYSRIQKFLKDKNLELSCADKTVLLDILLQINSSVRLVSGNQAMIKKITNAELADTPPMLVGAEEGDLYWFEDNQE